MCVCVCVLVYTTLWGPNVPTRIVKPDIFNIWSPRGENSNSKIVIVIVIVIIKIVNSKLC